ncbi:MurR/RpiR family transcriptional regulator [Cupriavidus taiwanensis]|uniref:HTH transcriptional regulator, Sugar isomerase (SIS)domain RpiR family n=1 Tax=Cupriavidus taiwanensis (strain DSM 17343 / BCRC 17206 / CCUG 44338 / CIP 107171 / LMG 19424 / R1) TaxID=977880 RepID=B3RC57_CUPTR|nr:MurR/RpiR family transcriptional regulator [Cupriavidus taiwanensis]CAQ72482.1 putative HTH transcriptional regulator, Sugar isomerase (SIS)domain; RpiR family [Cupriavidus taiwanensis LMG 19424]SOY64581.1 putative HTH transcriptional regulator, Sugar isomerase (SIS)domain; RpiR family [Cupriavidus taiwanensis]
MKKSDETASRDATLLDRLAREAANLTARERELADVLSRGYPHVLLESATALAARHGTSASTVVRLFAKLGYTSYADAQREARAGVTAMLPTAGQRAPATIGGKRTLRACVDDALLHDQHNLAATRESLDLAAFEAVARLLAGPRGRLFVLAQKNSAPVGAWLALHLNMCRPRVQELGSGAVTATDAMLWVEPDDVLLTFSIRRYSAAPVQIARVFRKCGARVVAICDSPAAPLVPLSDHHLLVRTTNASPFDSYTAAFFLCNALVSAVAQLRHPDVIEALQRRDTLWEAFEADLDEGMCRD